MKTIIATIFTLTLIVSSVSGADNPLKELSVGEARVFNGQTVYVEKHTSVFDESNALQTLETNYFSNDKKFGYFKTNYTNNPYLPNYEFKDERRHRQVNVAVRDGLVYATIRVGQNAEPKSKTYPMKPNLVGGQGLHNYLRDHVDEFSSNRDRVDKIEFLIPLNEDSYSFRIRVKQLDENKNTLTYRVEADSWLMRMVAPDIDVTYNTKTRQLMVYDGPSNLLTPEGEKMDVVITYSYPRSEEKQQTAGGSVASAE